MKKIKSEMVIYHKALSYMPCVSLYASNAKDFYQVLEESQDLARRHLNTRQHKYLFGPVDELIEQLPVDKWDFPMGLFLNESLNGFVNLPFEVEPLAVVASSFHVKPLLKLRQREHPFMVVYFTKREAILYRGSATELREVERLRFSTLREIGDMSTAIDRALYRLNQSATTPLILAGDIEQAELFKDETLFPHVVDEIIIEVVDHNEKSRLHREATRVLEPFLARQEDKLLKLFETSERSGRITFNLNEIMDNAIRKRIRHIFINEGENIWGRVNPSDGRPTYSAKMENCVDDILDDLAELVLKNGGGVTILSPEKMPKGRSACAIFA